MTTCEGVRAELVTFLRSESDPAAAAEIEAHLKSCPPCRQEGSAMGEVMETAKGVPIPPEHLRDAVLGAVLVEQLGPSLRSAVPAVPPQSLRDSVLGAIEPKVRPTSLRSRRRGEFVLGVAAVAAALVAFVSFSQLQSARDELSARKQPQSGGSIPSGHEMQMFTLDGQVRSEAGLDHYRHDNFRLTLSVSAYEVTPPGFQYAVWLRGEEGVVPLGGFRLKREGDDFNVPFAIAVDPVLYPEVLVTLEPIDGDPSLDGEIVNSAFLDETSIHHGRYDP